jgi:hypothetical protein
MRVVIPVSELPVAKLPTTFPTMVMTLMAAEKATGAHTS